MLSWRRPGCQKSSCGDVRCVKTWTANQNQPRHIRQAQLLLGKARLLVHQRKTKRRRSLTRLADYDVPMIRFLDVQYFAAGLLPGSLVIISAWVVASALNFNMRTPVNTDVFAPVVTGIRLVDWVLMLLMGVPIIYLVSLVRSGKPPMDEIERIVNTMRVNGSLLVVFLSELFFWILIVVFRRIARWAKGKEQHFPLLDAGLMLTILLSSCALLTALPLVITPTIMRFYESIPQVYGGGQPLRVTMLVDSQKVPEELLPSGTNQTPERASITKPLCLVFQTTDFYIVASDCSRNPPTWVINPDNVYAVTKAP